MVEQLHDGPDTTPGGDLAVSAQRAVGRQPIVGLDDEVVAFRLLHREVLPIDASDSGLAESIVLADVLADPAFDVASLAGERQLYCRPWPGLLDGPPPLEQILQRMVLEIPQALCEDPQLSDSCRALRERGCSLAVEVSTWDDNLVPLLEAASVVEIDLTGHDPDEVADLVERCRPYDVTLLATGCSSEGDLAWAAEVGFQLFQGPAIERPERLGVVLAPSALGRVQLATELLNERLDFRRAEEILEHEPALVVQVLKEASLGAAGGLRREVRSIRDALIVMGSTRLRQWAALAVFAQTAGNSRSDALTVALTRARMCEIVGLHRGIDHGYAFTAGMLSTLDRLLGVPMRVVERRVDVDPELAAAAFHRQGRVGEVVSLVRDYQLAIEAGAPAITDTAETDRIAAMAFPWAMSRINAIERVTAISTSRNLGNEVDARFVIGHA